MSQPTDAERETPETDAQQWVAQFGDSKVAHESIKNGYAFARRLERERDEAREEIARLTGEVGRAANIIKEQNDVMFQSQLPLREALERLEAEKVNWQDGRMEGRRELLSELIRMDPEVFDNFVTSFRDHTDDTVSVWKYEELREHFKTDERVGAYERIEGLYWDAMGRADEARYLLDQEREAALLGHPVSAWRSMESAPKDGTRILLFIRWEDVPVVGFWCVDSWAADTSNYECNTGAWGNGGTVERNFTDDDVFRWQPLPPPPGEEVKDG